MTSSSGEGDAHANRLLPLSRADTLNEFVPDRCLRFLCSRTGGFFKALTLVK